MHQAEATSSQTNRTDGDSLAQLAANKSASDGKHDDTVGEVIQVTTTDPAAEQSIEHVEPPSTAKRESYVQSFTSPPHRDNVYNFIWGEDINPYNSFSGEEFKVKVLPTADPPLERSISQKGRPLTFIGEGENVPSERDDIHSKAADAHSPTVTQDMQNVFAQQQREIRDAIAKQNEKVVPQGRPARVTAKHVPSHSAALDMRESILERREREFDRREREIDRRERDLERRERELERRQREFDNHKGRWNPNGQHSPWNWQDAMDNFKNQLTAELLAERKKAIERETLFEEKIIKKVNKVLEHERQLFGMMRMSENEVNEMVENSVGYLLHNDEDIADRVRFQSLLYLTQERLATEAGLKPPSGSDSFSLSWRLALGPSVVTEDRYKKALELLKDKDLNESTKKVVECGLAMEYAVEYTSHLRKEGPENGDLSFSFGRIPRKDYMESLERHSSQDPTQFEALKILVDFVSPET